MKVVDVDRRSRVNNQLMCEANSTLIQHDSDISEVYIGYSGSTYNEHLNQLCVAGWYMEISDLRRNLLGKVTFKLEADIYKQDFSQAKGKR